jgi:2-isopropylmalate synthase
MLRQLERTVIWHKKRKQTVFLSDTTLRDGEQMPGIRLNAKAKVAIAAALADAGIHSIDAGSPAASPEEIEAIRRIVKEVHGPVIMAHCRTLASDIDKAAEAFEGASLFKKGITVFVGISPVHRERKHRKSKADIVRMSVDAIQYAKRCFRIVTFGPEDAGRTEPDYLYEIYREAIDAGATAIGFADTVGILTPEKAADRIKGIQDNVPNLSHALLAVHFHNDLGLATANALACVAEGVDIVQGTINGMGERAGNTPLEEVVLALGLHRDQYRVGHGVDPRKLGRLSRLVADLTGFRPPPNKAVVGDGLFVAESGVHQDGLLKDPATYLPFLPSDVGGDFVRLVLGKHSGRRAVRYRMQEHGIELTDAQAQQVVGHLKTSARKSLYDSEDDLRGLLAEVFPDGFGSLSSPVRAASGPPTGPKESPLAGPPSPKPR